MHPRLLTTPVYTVRTFGVLLAAAYLIAYWWMLREGRRQRLDVDALGSLGMWAIVGAIVGARVLMIARDFSQYAAAPSELLSPTLLVAAGDFYGGFIGALVMSAIFFRRNPQLPFWKAADVCAPAIALGQSIGRIGCLMAGDDFGRAAQVPWAITFTDPMRPPSAEPRSACRCIPCSCTNHRVSDSLHRARAAQPPQALRWRSDSRVHLLVRGGQILSRVLPR